MRYILLASQGRTEPVGNVTALSMVRVLSDYGKGEQEFVSCSG